MTPKQTLDSLDEAGRLLAPILQAEALDRGYIEPDVPAIHIGVGGLLSPAFSITGFVGPRGEGKGVYGHGETLSAAFVQFLANRSDKLRELEREAQERAEFEAFKAQKREGVDVAA